MIFTFWTEDTENGGASTTIPQAVTAWRQQYPDMGLYSDDSVIPLLAEFGDNIVDLYRRIRIPACKSDIARLLLLYKIGGLYVDSHSGPGDPRRLLNIFDKITEYEVLIVDKNWEHKFENDIHLINGIMGAHKGSEIVKRLLDGVLLNLKQHDAKEQAAESYVPYNLAVLSGAWNLRVNLFQPSGNGVVIKKEFADRIYQLDLKHGEDCGIILYKYYSYRKQGGHWSERQQHERLFLRRSDLPDAGG